MTKVGSRGPKREQVTNACTACRLSKLKCNGRHPTCSRCHTRDLECVYDVSEGMTKRQHLNHELSEQREELTRATAVLRVLQFGTDQEATASLARLRIGNTVSQEYQLLQAHPQPPSTERDPGKIPDNASQQQVDAMSNSQSDTSSSWRCPPSVEPYPGTQQYEWDDSASERMTDWMQPMGTVAKEDVSATVYSAKDSPILDMSMPTPSSEAGPDERGQCMGG